MQLKLMWSDTLPRSKQASLFLISQPYVSHKLRERPKLEARINDNPTALSSKRPRIVTCPEVERALVLWVQHMETLGETVTGGMLREKRKHFEVELKVPDEEKFLGEGWVASFCKTYKIREHQRHGESGSVDLEAVEAERK
jgi:hypothetical protein